VIAPAIPSAIPSANPPAFTQIESATEIPGKRTNKNIRVLPMLTMKLILQTIDQEVMCRDRCMGSLKQTPTPSAAAAAPACAGSAGVVKGGSSTCYSNGELDALMDDMEGPLPIENMNRRALHKGATVMTGLPLIATTLSKFFKDSTAQIQKKVSNRRP